MTAEQHLGANKILRVRVKWPGFAVPGFRSGSGIGIDAKP